MGPEINGASLIAERVPVEGLWRWAVLHVVYSDGQGGYQAAWPGGDAKPVAIVMKCYGDDTFDLAEYTPLEVRGADGPR